MQYSFGSGVLYGRRTDTSNATPVRFGGLQDVSIDFAFTNKPLFGGLQFPLAIGRGTGKIGLKAKYAQFNAQAFNDLFFGEASVATGSTRTSVAEAQTITANVVNPTHNTTFAADAGVVKSSDGTLFTRVANSPTGQQYSCNETTGVYTFNSSQNNTAVQVSYTYADASNGKIITITNKLLGTAPTFSAIFTEKTADGKQQTLTLNSCMSNKLTLATKLEDWQIPEFDADVFADSSGTIGTFSMEE